MKKRNMIALGGMAAVFAVGGSLAYFNQTMTAENNFDTGKYGTTLVEDFKPSEGHNWQPGATVDKVVKVENTGDQPVVVRVRFDEDWTRKDGEKAFATLGSTAVDGTNQIVTPLQKDHDEADGDDQSGAKDGLTDGDYTVVEKELANTDKWAYNEEDGYYYYVDVVQPGAENATGAILNAVTLLKNADMGKFQNTKFYSDTETLKGADGEWKPFEVHEDTGIEYTEKEMEEWAQTQDPKVTIYHMKDNVATGTDEDGKALEGYSNANYVLHIKADTVQVTEDAIVATFGQGVYNAHKTDWGFNN